MKLNRAKLAAYLDSKLSWTCETDDVLFAGFLMISTIRGIQAPPLISSADRKRLVDAMIREIEQEAGK